MQFVHQTLMWGFLIALVPLLIHLINMLRHQRVKWAAMDFLLKSYKKHRTWVWLKQLILLLMRMVAIALIVGMLAQWVSQGQWLNLFGGKVTHHYVLLDDSLSMADRFGGTSAFETGIRAIQQLATRAAEQETRQKFTLIRFSLAARMQPAKENGDEPAKELEPGEAVAKIAQIADLNAEIVDAGFPVRLEEKRNSLELTELAVGPRPALELLKQLLADQGRDETNLVYVVSDFRTNPWESPAELRELLHEVEKTPAEIRLVGCANATRTNLAITAIEPLPETRAAGVPLFVNIDVRNFGPDTAEKVQLKVRTTFYEPDTQKVGSPGKTQGETAELPTVLIDKIGPGETITKRVQVFFPEPGKHVVEALLPDDPVAADNRRWCVIDFPEAERVLVVDGHVSQRNAYYITSSFQPGQRANTGIRPEVQPIAFLRDATPELLAPFSVIYLLDVDRLDDRAVENLEKYVASGGGLAIFAGERLNPLFYRTKFYNDGKGLFPVPLAGEDVMVPLDVPGEKAPDLEVEPHPIFDVFAGDRNPLIRMVAIERYWKPPTTWTPAPDSTVKVIAKLRNKTPLVVERKFGDGRVLAVLTTAAPVWNNWGRDPSFVVVLLKMQSYLASARRQDDTRFVGAPIELQLDQHKFRKDLSFVTPGSGPLDRRVLEQTLEKPADDSPLMSISLGVPAGSTKGETDRSGLYEAWPMTLDGKFDVRRWAVNVDPAESDLTVAPSPKIVTKLEPVKVEFAYADQYEYEQVAQAGFNRSLMLMTLLVALLIGEQALAYALSYHPAKVAVR